MSTSPCSSALTTSGCASRNFCVTTRSVVTYLPSGHRSFSSTRTLPAGLELKAGGVRLRDPGAVDLARRERGQGLAVVLRDDADVAAAGLVGLEPLLLEPVAQRHVLGVAQLGRGDLLALEVGGRGDARLHDQIGPAGGSTGDDLDRLALGLGPGVDRRVRSDEARVDRAAEERLDGLRPGVERRGLQRHVAAEVLGVDALLDAGDGDGVGEVREVAEPQRHLGLRTRPPIRQQKSIPQQRRSHRSSEPLPHAASPTTASVATAAATSSRGAERGRRFTAGLLSGGRMLVAKTY